MRDDNLRINQLDARLSARIDDLGTSLRAQMEDLRDQIRFVAEVQSVHGEKLDNVASDVQGLKSDVADLKVGIAGLTTMVVDLRAFVKRVADNHEGRL